MLSASVQPGLDCAKLDFDRLDFDLTRFVAVECQDEPGIGPSSANVASGCCGFRDGILSIITLTSHSLKAAQNSEKPNAEGRLSWQRC